MKLFYIQYLLVFLMLFQNAQGQINSLATGISSSSQGVDLKSGLNNYTPDYFTGRLSYTAALKKVSIAGIDFPIALTYSTNGIRVQDVAQNVGLGWSFSLEGEVTREVRGLPDEENNGYSGSARIGGKNYAVLNEEYVQKISDNLWDGQPDNFVFSFLGFKGSFQMDPDGNPVLQSNQTGVKIEFCPFKRGTPYNTQQSEWRLRDQSGNLYVFARPIMVQSLIYGFVGVTEKKYVGSWKITKIITAANQQIDFTYSPSLYNQSVLTYNNTRRIDTEGKIECLGDDHLADQTYSENSYMSVMTPYDLVKISGNNVNINLEYNLLRSDLNTKALTDISVDYKKKLINAYKLNYGYFTSTDGSNTKRLKLQYITERPVINNYKTIYRFYYNEIINLPARNSKKTDYLGYYNNNSQNSDITNFADKSPYLPHTMANVLEKVKSVFGGVINFEYELNTYYEDNLNKVGCGLRVKNIYETKGTSDTARINKSTISYNVPGSTNSSGRQFYFYDPAGRYVVSIFCEIDAYNGVTRPMSFYRSNTFAQRLDETASNISYSTATITKSDGSFTRYTFTNYQEYPDQYIPSQFYSGPSSNQIPPSTINFSTLASSSISKTSPYGSENFFKTSYAFARGKVLKEEMFDSNNQCVKSTDYTYSLTPPLNKLIGITGRLRMILKNNKNYVLVGNTFFNQDLQLTSKTTKFYKNNIAQQSSIERYTYTDYAKNLIRSVTKTIGQDKSKKVSYRYPFDVIPYIPTTVPNYNYALTSMTYYNQIEAPVEVIQSVIEDNTENGIEKIYAINVTRYVHNINKPILPYCESKLEIKSPIPVSQYTRYTVGYDDGNEEDVIDVKLKPYLFYTDYTNKGTLLQTQLSSTQPSVNSKLYGYDGQYTIADIRNAEQVNIAYSSFESEEKGNWTYLGPAIYNTQAITGNSYYDLATGNLSKSGLTATKTYILTYWTKNGSYYSITGTQGTPTLLADRNGWKNYQHNITGRSSITLTGTGFIDEVRLYPMGANMKTYTYEPLLGKSSENDERGNITYYSYDEFNRPKNVRDSKRTIVRAKDYTYRGEPLNYFKSFLNTAKSKAFYKTDCPAGYSGTQTTYSVNANIYEAASQQAADELAQNDIDLNGPVFANNYCSCFVQPIYIRIEHVNLSNTYYWNSSDDNLNKNEADVYIKLYSDSGCTTPFSSATPINVIVKLDEGFSSTYGGSTSNTQNINYNIQAGTSSYLIGHYILDSYVAYPDSYGATESSFKTFTVINNNGIYTPLPTH